MIEDMVSNIIEKKISTKYPHIQLPSIVMAKITAVITVIENTLFLYNLKILDKNGEVDERFPEIPEVKSTIKTTYGKTVVIGLLYGELNPYIIGEVS